MAFNGSGVYVLPVTTVTPATASTSIDSSDFNTFTADLATALSLCLTEDGQNTPTANLPMAGYKHTGAAAGVNSGDYSTIGGVETITGDKTISGDLDLTGAFSIGGTAVTKTAAEINDLVEADGSVPMSGALTISRTAPLIRLDETDASADNGSWDILVDVETLYMRAVNDALSSASAFMTVSRTGTTIDGTNIEAPATNTTATGGNDIPNKTYVDSAISTGVSTGITTALASSPAITTPTITSPTVNGQTGYGWVFLSTPFTVVSSSTVNSTVQVDMSAVYAQAHTDGAKVAILNIELTSANPGQQTTQSLFYARNSSSPVAVGFLKASIREDNASSPVGRNSTEIHLPLDGNSDFWWNVQTGAGTCITRIYLTGYLV